jgi:hypothetical protein
VDEKEKEKERLWKAHELLADRLDRIKRTPMDTALETRVVRIEERLIKLQEDLNDHCVEFREYEKKIESQRNGYFLSFLTEKAFKQWVEIAFNPIKAFVYGILGTIAGGALVAGLAFLFKKP